MTGVPAGLRRVLERAEGEYQARFGASPEVLAFAPGRVNLIGEHTDYTGGLALPMAIDRWCTAAAGRAREASRCGVASADVGEPAWLDLSRPLREGEVARGAWVSYVAGVVGEMQRELAGRGRDELPAVNIAVASSVPLGSGLSSSAALEVAAATALEGLVGVRMEAMGKARLCQRAERKWAGVGCGLMDQMSAVLGREGCALLMDFSAETVEAVELPRGVAVVVANSGVRHELAAGEYGKRVEACERARRGLGVASLRGATLEQVRGAAGRLDEDARRCAEHVVEENRRVLEAAGALRGGDLRRFGALMRESHASLRDTYRVSCTELDALVEIAAEVTGVFGARMTGGGFGGCVVAAVEEGAVAGLVQRWESGYPARCGRGCEVFVVRASGGAGRVDEVGSLVV